MHAIRATWTNGRILPLEPIDWPEGTELMVQPVTSSEKIGMDESDWRDDPESVAAWIAAVVHRKIERTPENQAGVGIGSEVIFEERKMGERNMKRRGVDDVAYMSFIFLSPIFLS